MQAARSMQAANRLQKALRTGSGLTFGAWQMLPGSNHARTIARCGFDWVLVDTEHGNIDGKWHKAWFRGLLPTVPMLSPLPLSKEPKLTSYARWQYA